MRYAFEISYLGADFYGSQQQTDKRTVAGEILNALAGLNLFSQENAGEAHFMMSGRTDKGVSARSQVAAFNTDFPQRVVKAVNQKLPPDILFRGWTQVPDDYNPRYDVKTRTYRYYFPSSCGADVSVMKECAVLFTGEHDFTAFSRTSDRSPVREIISSEIKECGDGFVYLEIRGYSFLWNMVRCISESLIEAGCGVIKPEDIKTALDSPDKFGRRFMAAAPEGLILWEVESGLEFKPVCGRDKKLESLSIYLNKLSQLEKTSSECFR